MQHNQRDLVAPKCSTVDSAIGYIEGLNAVADYSNRIPKIARARDVLNAARKRADKNIDRASPEPGAGASQVRLGCALNVALGRLCRHSLHR